MDARKLFSCLLLCSSLLFIGIEVVESSRHHRQPKKLFVFGDSYADTGNALNPPADSWKEPYGITYPGKPSGRFSDGHIFTDFLAKSLGINSPLPYIRRNAKRVHLTSGMNFAFGGTGVFDTQAPYPNMTTQIDIFQKLIDEAIFTTQDLSNSLVHVSLAGNDYSYYLAKGGSVGGLEVFIQQVINQLEINLKRIHKLGVKKISVTILQPLGCLPVTTYPSFQQCNSTFNQATQFHNLLLQQSISRLNNQTSNSTSTPFITIDFYKAFSSVIEAKEVEQKNLKFNALLEPCCKGINSTYYCGSVDAIGNKLYTVCKEPRSYFFWDSEHPTQAGWQALTLSLQSTILKLRY